MTHPGRFALRAKAREWARSERCQDSRPGALSNRLLLALDEYPRFEELTKVLEMHSSQPLCNPTVAPMPMCMITLCSGESWEDSFRPVDSFEVEVSRGEVSHW